MRRALLFGLILQALVSAPVLAAKQKSQPAALTPEIINSAQWAARDAAGKFSALVLKAEVLLSRAGFSPGVIDAHHGENLQKALRAYQQTNSLQATGELDAATWSKLSQTSSEEAVRRYAITEADVEGPFVKRIPKDYEEMAELDELGYRSARELLAEKFHMSEELLAALNKGKDFGAAGTELIVANIAPLEIEKLGSKRAGAKAGNDGSNGENGNVERVEVNKTERAVRVFNRQGALIAYYPASIGSSEKPAPSGKVEVRSIALKPTYRYDPKYEFKGQKATDPIEVSPGPNNPVGLVWIALSAESYGIHGTPEPDKISKTESHGCVRLTNWDAVALAKLVRKGTPVEFVD
jgi:lipoprotein-anchoring transpeptidase ErfK/SrfK